MFGLTGCIAGDPVPFDLAYNFAEENTVEVLLPACGDHPPPPYSLELRDSASSNDGPPTLMSVEDGDFEVQRDFDRPLWRIPLASSDIINPDRTTMRVFSENEEVSWLGVIILDQVRPVDVFVTARGDYEGLPERVDYSPAPVSSAELADACDD
ncbi:hypothetical protein [Jannaschia sp. R86511]|uniref:hypothetical protein n=1 Tax=Jannaschia sp. R86511 TaxID=3093853 RepID=UPI0036D2FDCA